MHKHLEQPIFKLIGQVADELQRPCFVIGGYVRDKLMEIDNKDVDMFVYLVKSLGAHHEKMDGKVKFALLTSPEYQMDVVLNKKDAIEFQKQDALYNTFVTDSVLLSESAVKTARVDIFADAFQPKVIQKASNPLVQNYQVERMKD